MKKYIKPLAAILLVIAFVIAAAKIYSRYVYRQAKDTLSKADVVTYYVKNERIEITDPNTVEEIIDRASSIKIGKLTPRILIPEFSANYENHYELTFYENDEASYVSMVISSEISRHNLLWGSRHLPNWLKLSISGTEPLIEYIENVVKLYN